MLTRFGVECGTVESCCQSDEGLDKPHTKGNAVSQASILGYRRRGFEHRVDPISGVLTSFVPFI
jgi:hypothetical protein